MATQSRPKQDKFSQAFNPNDPSIITLVSNLVNNALKSGAVGQSAEAMNRMNPAYSMAKLAVTPASQVGQAMQDPFLQGANSALKKAGTDMMMEAIQTEGPQAAQIRLQRLEQQKQAEQAQVSQGASPQMDLSQLMNSPTMGASAFNYNQQQSGSIPPAGGAANEFNRLNQALAGKLPQQTTPVQPQMGASPVPQMLPSASPFSGASIDQQGNISQQGMAARILGNILPAFFPSTSTNEAITQQSALYDLAGKRQEVAGEKPLQKGEREKVGLETERAILQETIKQQREGLLKPQDLLTKYEQASQPFITQRDAFSRIQASTKNPSAAGDLATIFGYMKLLDPGSTVREGEFATAQNSAGIPERIRNIYNRVTNGQRLSSKQRQDFVGQAGKIFKAAETQQKRTSNEFAKLGRSSGIDPKVFMRDVGLASEESRPSSKLPSKRQAPQGAKGWDTQKGTWVY